MIDGWLLLLMGALVGVTDFAVGLYLVRRSPDARPLHSEGMELSATATQRVGRLVMFTAPLVFLVFALLAFGLIPVEGIAPIALGGGQ